MGEGWCQVAQTVGQIVGARIVVCYKKEVGRWEVCEWIAEPLVSILGTWRAPELDDQAELIQQALRRKIHLTEPLLGLGGLQPELKKLLGQHISCGVSIGLTPTLTEAMVLWVGMPREIEASLLEDLSRFIETVVCPPRCSYRSFFDNIPELFVDVAADGTVEHCNNYIKQLGYEVQELVGGPITRLFSQDEWDRLLHSVSETSRAERTKGLIRHASGEIIAMDLTMLVVEDPMKGATRTMLMGSDTRQLHQLENYRRLESVSRLVSGVAHELNNPLQTVVGNAEMLADMKLPDAARRRAQRVLAGSRRCQEVVDGMVKLKRKQREMVDLVDLEELVGRTIQTVESEFEQLKVPIRIEGPPDLPMIKGNRQDLGQALENVLRNAFQAVADRANPEQQILIFVSEETVQLSVQDNGPGLEPEALDRAFEPFFTTRGVGAGKGLGLSIALGIVQEHGGFIEIQSTSSGARVLITLPIDGY